MTEVLKRGFPGMKSVKDLPVTQDVPPPGGFPAIRINRRLPSTGPTGVTIFGVGLAVMAYGFYGVYTMVQERKEYRREIQMMRAAMVPYLQAEVDERYEEKRKKDLEEEARIMAKVPGWVVGESVSATGRWIPPRRPIGVWDELNL